MHFHVVKMRMVFESLGMAFSQEKFQYHVIWLKSFDYNFQGLVNTLEISEVELPLSKNKSCVGILRK